MHMRATQHFIMVFSSRPRKKRKETKLCTRESSQQAKEEREIFLGFLLITTASMESKLAKKLQLIFLVFLKVFQTHKKNVGKENKLAWILQ